ncbi:hsp70 protein domain-containing protein [Ditylenchus destructor]|uniref:Hsp70 protein domain-containing protein n=1 Tax=Ditylenchus destructor TaxID=166010 RepID=A0AAD4R493_9BILA|nr:hsp70 protein domain-containing protein [Ditylenchus destructor]
MFRRVLNLPVYRVSNVIGCFKSNVRGAVIGIDLGTTNSCVAIMEGKQAKLVEKERDQKLVSVTKEGLELPESEEETKKFEEDLINVSDESLALSYDEFDVLVLDINEKVLNEIGRAEGIKNLSEGTFPSAPFPANGVIYAPNNRYMVPLVCQIAERPSLSTKHIWFLVDTGAPFTCLTEKTLEAFVGAGQVTNDYYRLAIQDQNIEIICRISKEHYKEVNILGTDALRKLDLSIHVDWKKEKFQLVKS